MNRWETFQVVYVHVLFNLQSEDDIYPVNSWKLGEARVKLLEMCLAC